MAKKGLDIDAVQAWQLTNQTLASFPEVRPIVALGIIEGLQKAGILSGPLGDTLQGVIIARMAVETLEGVWDALPVL